MSGGGAGEHRRTPATEPEAPPQVPPRVVAEELSLLEQVAGRLAALPRRPPTATESSIAAELERVRDLLVSGSAGKDEAALSEQWHRQNALLRQIRSGRDARAVDPLSPYFAHLRLREDGRERDLCLGRATCIDGGLRIVDWRNAPVSRIYYRYEQDEEYEESFAGRPRAGTVLARRSVDIRDGRLVRVDAPEGVFAEDARESSGWRRVRASRPRLSGGEAAALRAHGMGGPGAGPRRALDPRAGDGSSAPTDRRLAEITRLIDPAQFDAIARPASGYLAIRGAAGSGKTTVALHRIAYLAYEDPRIDSPETLFVVFSPALRAYVGHVLPALGVEGVGLRTYGEWAAGQRARHFPRLPASTASDAPAEVERLKLHPALGRALALQVSHTPGPATPEQALDDWASTLTNLPLLEACCAREAPGEFSGPAIARFVEWNRRRREELIATLEGQPGDAAELAPEDDTLLLRAWQLRVGPLLSAAGAPLRYRHLAVDEVQDFSPLEVRVLLDCLDERRSVTLAGDTQQHLMEHSGFTSWSDFLGHLGISGAHVETLQVSYRSSQEIASFARSVLGPLAERDEILRCERTGPPVELFRFSEVGACVAFLAEALTRLAREEPRASVAVLTPTPERSALYHRSLEASDVPRVRRIDEWEFAFSPGVEVTEIEKAKGLEFDYVVLMDVTREHFPETAAARRRLHVGASRAIHQLWLTCLGTPSALLPPLEPGPA